MKSNRVDKLCLIASMLENIFITEYGEIVPPVKIILNAYDDKVFYLTEKNNKNSPFVLLLLIPTVKVKSASLRP